METFSKSLGDTIPTANQLSALYRAGELHFADRDYEEARKHWEFCANQAVGFQNNYFLVLGTSKALEAELLFNPDKDWKDEIAAVATVLDSTALHFVERKRFDVYLQYLIGINALNVGDTSTVERALTEMKSLGRCRHLELLARTERTQSQSRYVRTWFHQSSSSTWIA